MSATDPSRQQEDRQGPRPVVLSVDDEPNILSAIKRSLRPVGAEIITVDSAPAALELLQKTHVDIVISDMRMPEMNGAEFLKQVGAKYPGTRRILLTGYADMESTTMAVNDGGICSIIAKPWNDDHLREVVQEAINRVRQSQQREHSEEILREENRSLHDLNDELEDRVEARTRDLVEEHQRLEVAVADLSHAHGTMVDLLARMVSLHDPQGTEDQQDKKALAAAIAKDLRYEPEKIEAVEYATSLHRIGLMGLEDRLLHIPLKKMGSRDLEAYRRHPAFAEALLMGVSRLNAVAVIIRSQHERWDGEGFPHRAGQREIPDGSRVLAVARDFYDLIAGRIEPRKLSPKEAAEVIIADSGHAYDPEVVSAFKRVHRSATALDTRIDETYVRSVALQPGMKLSRDLVTPDGLLLLNKYQVLSAHIIAKIVNLEATIGQPLDLYIRNSN